MLTQIIWRGHTIGEISCPTRYFEGASSIGLRRSIRYGFGCLATSLAYRLAKLGLRSPEPFTGKPGKNHRRAASVTQ